LEYSKRDSLLNNILQLEALLRHQHLSGSCLNHFKIGFYRLSDSDEIWYCGRYRVIRWAWLWPLSVWYKLWCTLNGNMHENIDDLKNMLLELITYWTFQTFCMWLIRNASLSCIITPHLKPISLQSQFEKWEFSEVFLSGKRSKRTAPSSLKMTLQRISFY
jgi:hypothetical protein